MEEAIKQFLNGIGFGLLWIFGMFIVPFLIMIIYGLFSNFIDDDGAKIVFWISFILYWLATALFLIFI